MYSNGDVQEWHIGDYGAIYYDGFREHENGLRTQSYSRNSSAICATRPIDKAGGLES